MFDVKDTRSTALTAPYQSFSLIDLVCFPKQLSAVWVLAVLIHLFLMCDMLPSTKHGTRCGTIYVFGKVWRIYEHNMLIMVCRTRLGRSRGRNIQSNNEFAFSMKPNNKHKQSQIHYRPPRCIFVRGTGPIKPIYKAPCQHPRPPQIPINACPSSRSRCKRARPPRRASQPL